jgi:hypothetical protein
MDSVAAWLASIGLSQYGESFEKEGYDDLAVIKDLNESDLDAIGVKLAGHRKKLLLECKKLGDGKAASAGDAPFWSSTEKDPAAPLRLAELRRCEHDLGVTLPASLVKLLRDRNGGSLEKPIVVKQSDGDDEVMPIDFLFGCDTGSKEGFVGNTDTMVEEWDCEPGLVALSGDGHWWYALDYRLNKDVPSVVYIDTDLESYTTVAPTFDELIASNK